jgi:hypothetical protein
LDDVTVDNDALLMTEFMNLKIKLAQSFKSAHRDMMYMYRFIEINAHIYKYLYLYYVSKKLHYGRTFCTPPYHD